MNDGVAAERLIGKQIHLLAFASLPEVPRGNGIVNYLIATKNVEARAMHTGISRLAVGVFAPRHSHNAEEQVTVLEGSVTVMLSDSEQVCHRYDSTFISAGVEHEFVNVGSETAYVLVICGLLDVGRAHAATGKTVDIGSEGDRFAG